MMRLIVNICAAALLSASPSALRAAVLDDVVATVNGEDILLSVFKKHVDAYTEAAARMRPGAFSTEEERLTLKKEILDQLVGDLLFKQKAEKEKIKVGQRELDNAVAEIKKRMFGRDEKGKVRDEGDIEQAFRAQLKKDGLTLSKFRSDIMTNLKIKKFYDQRIIPSVEKPKDGEIKAFFEKANKVAGGDEALLKGLSKEERDPLLALAEQLKIATAEKVEAQHILIRVTPDASILEKSRALKKAKEIKKEIDGGGDFAALAKEHSADPGSAKRGGKLPPFVKGMMVPEFEKAAFALRVGEVSAPVLSDFGYHIIRLTGRQASKSVELEEAKPQIMEFLYNVKVQRKLAETAKDLRKAATIRYVGEGKKISAFEPKKSSQKKKG